MKIFKRIILILFIIELIIVSIYTINEYFIWMKSFDLLSFSKVSGSDLQGYIGLYIIFNYVLLFFLMIGILSFIVFIVYKILKSIKFNTIKFYFIISILMILLPIFEKIVIKLIRYYYYKG